MMTNPRKIALVTGASRGLGREIALELAANSYDVILSCKERIALAEEVAAKIGEIGQKAWIFPADLADSLAIQALASKTRAISASLDLLVCNAGTTLNRLILRTTPADFNDEITINLVGQARLCRALLPEIAAVNGQIVLISSRAALVGNSGQAAYTCAKAGLIGLGAELAAECAGAGVRVNTVLPGYLPTEMGLAAGEKVVVAAREANFLQRLNDCGEVARFISHLAGMKNVSGQVFNLDSRPLDMF